MFFFTVKEFALEETNKEELVSPLCITKDTAIVAQAFVQYFARQRRAMNKVFIASTYLTIHLH